MPAMCFCSGVTLRLAAPTRSRPLSSSSLIVPVAAPLTTLALPAPWVTVSATRSVSSFSWKVSLLTGTRMVCSTVSPSNTSVPLAAV